MASLRQADPAELTAEINGSLARRHSTATVRSITPWPTAPGRAPPTSSAWTCCMSGPR